MDKQDCPIQTNQQIISVPSHISYVYMQCYIHTWDVKYIDIVFEIFIHFILFSSKFDF